MFRDEAAGHQFRQECVIHRRTAVGIEALEGLVADHLRFAQPLRELALIAAGDFILQQQRQEIRIGQLGVDGLAVSCFERIENAGQAQLFEHGFELGHGVHEDVPDRGIRERAAQCSRSAGVRLKRPPFR